MLLASERYDTFHDVSSTLLVNMFIQSHNICVHSTDFYLFFPKTQQCTKVMVNHLKIRRIMKKNAYVPTSGK